MRRYASDTTVAISKSRAEIDALLRAWGADGVQWTDEWGTGKITLRFTWHVDGHGHQGYHARFSITLPTPAALKSDVRVLNRWGLVVEGKLAKLVAANGRSEHRVLLLWLKAAFNAVDAGIVSAEALFLPFLEGSDGATVAEVALPKLATLLTARADRLLGTGGAK